MKYLLKHNDLSGADFLRVLLNEDNTVSVKEFDFESFVKPLTYNMVDLGLDSGILWADRNVGALSPEDGGLYFQWGDTVGYTAEQIADGEKAFASDYSDTPFFVGGNCVKYNGSDGLETLESADDAATVNMGSAYRMPTQEEIQELWNLEKKWIVADVTNGVVGEGVEDDSFDATGMSFDDNNNIDLAKSDKVFLGVKFIGKNGNSIFVPASGSVYGGAVWDRGHCGGLWSSSLCVGDVRHAWNGGFNVDGVENVGDGYRFYGLGVRGVAGAGK